MHMRRLVFFLLFLASPLFSIDFEEIGEMDMAQGDQFISLGGTCHTALALRTNGLRKSAFPFDWFFTNQHQIFIKILDEDFAFFTDETHFHHTDGVPGVRNLYYNIFFPHDFDLTKMAGEEGWNQWKSFKKKYDRRIARFRELRKYPHRIFFFRTIWSSLEEGRQGQFNENTQKARELKEALDRYFPGVNFTLVILSYSDLNIPPVEAIPGVVEFRIGRSHQEFFESVKQLIGSN